MTVGGPSGLPGGIVVRPVVLAVEVKVTGGGPVAYVMIVDGSPGPPGRVVKPVLLAVEVSVTGGGLVR